MSTLTINSQPTLLDLANSMANGGARMVAEVLAQTNEIMLDAVWLPANMGIFHKFAERTSLPTGSWRKINDGVSPEASTKRPRSEGLGRLETFSEIDEALMVAADDPAAYRLQEDMSFLEGMAQTLSAAVIYADSDTDPEKFQGLAPRMDALSAPRVIGSGGTGSDVTSIYIVQWGANAAHFIYPKSVPAGIQMNDLGLQFVAGTTAGSRLQKWVTQFLLHCGLVVNDPTRNIARVANIESAGSSNIFDEDNLIKALNEMRDPTKCAIYVNRTVKAQMQIALKDKTNTYYTQDTEKRGDGLSGYPVLRFQGVPVRQVDAILNTESAIS